MFENLCRMVSTNVGTKRDQGILNDITDIEAQHEEDPKLKVGSQEVVKF